MNPPEASPDVKLFDRTHRGLTLTKSKLVGGSAAKHLKAKAQISSKTKWFKRLKY